MVVSGLELVNLCETRKWNTQFHRKISNGKTGLPFQKFHFFRKFSSGTNRKIMFHLQPIRNFRNLLVNGKHPLGVFHLPKDSGKFPKRRWEMLIGERRVSFDTLVPFIPGSLHRPMYYPPNYKMAAPLLLFNEC